MFNLLTSYLSRLVGWSAFCKSENAVKILILIGPRVFSMIYTCARAHEVFALGSTLVDPRVWNRRDRFGVGIEHPFAGGSCRTSFFFFFPLNAWVKNLSNGHIMQETEIIVVCGLLFLIEGLILGNLEMKR